MTAHRWTEASDDPVHCSRCGLLEWHARQDSECSNTYGVAEEASR